MVFICTITTVGCITIWTNCCEKTIKFRRVLNIFFTSIVHIFPKDSIVGCQNERIWGFFGFWKEKGRNCNTYILHIVGRGQLYYFLGTIWPLPTRYLCTNWALIKRLWHKLKYYHTLYSLIFNECILNIKDFK